MDNGLQLKKFATSTTEVTRYHLKTHIHIISTFFFFFFFFGQFYTNYSFVLVGNHLFYDLFAQFLDLNCFGYEAK